VRYSGIQQIHSWIQLDISISTRYVRIQLDTAGYSGQCGSRSTARWLDIADLYPYRYRYAAGYQIPSKDTVRYRRDTGEM